MLTKNKPIWIVLYDYLHYLDFISDDEITFIYSLLTTSEHRKLLEYKQAIWKNINNKREFLFLSNLIDNKN